MKATFVITRVRPEDSGSCNSLCILEIQGLRVRRLRIPSSTRPTVQQVNWSSQQNNLHSRPRLANAGHPPCHEQPACASKVTAISAGTMKIPEPIMAPTTTMMNRTGPGYRRILVVQDQMTLGLSVRVLPSSRDNLLGRLGLTIAYCIHKIQKRPTNSPSFNKP